MEVTIGGNRLGSGNKMQTELHHYNRSTHNLSKKFASSMCAGTLVPCYVNIGLPGDSWDIDIDTLVRTLPTNGPLFGSFKLQVDCFMIPMRLYQGILHNNAVNIGMKMNQVYFPTLEVTSSKNSSSNPHADSVISYTSLLRYLGISGNKVVPSNYVSDDVKRAFNAIPTIAYYDIYRNYYANKQEGKGFIITGDAITNDVTVCYYQPDFGPEPLPWEKGTTKTFTYMDMASPFHFIGSLSPQAIEFSIDGQAYTAIDLIALGWARFEPDIHRQGFYMYWTRTPNVIDKEIRFDSATKSVQDEISLQEFDLEVIDQMRQYCLSKNRLGDKATFTEFLTQYGNKYPYYTIEKKNSNARTMNGLAIKTYQSDIFNNWLNSEWIEGENSIQALTSIDTSSGEFNIDTLNLAQKLYNLFNRIAVSGGTYNDWRDAVYTDGKRLIESPIYCGGMSAEIGFEEVVGTAQTDSGGNVNHIGQLAGKGTQVNKKGGTLNIRCEEPCVIMAIASITPRLMYSNGNKWFNTELLSMDDLHKPALDGIGFQDLITEQMDWREAHAGVNNRLERYSAGKLPAWINYMTDYDEAFGDFADPMKCGWMVLGRNYEIGTNNRIKDLTTYIDPQKFNYAFADASLAAQNFWVQIGFDIKKRGLISAKVIPSI